jgi:2-polyprenyl-6-methoxyphenol hydroxylase-like FAD-dependent oxidoreductase
MSARYDAIVIGGGVAGATAAILLAKAGWRLALVEKHVFPRRKVCGECVAATNLGLLDALGVGDEFSALAGPPLEHVGLYVGENLLTADLPRFHDAAAAWGRALGREQLDTLLLQRSAALGVTVWQPWAVKDVVRCEVGYECSAVAQDRGDTVVLDAPVVIAANGSWEPSPRAADRTRAPGRGSDLLAFKANFAGADLAPGLLPVLAFPGGYGGMVIADDGKLTLACCIRRDRLRDWRARMSGAAAGLAVQALLEDTCRGVRQALRRAERLGPWLSAGPIRPGVRSAWHEQRGFAVGNAAGEAHPILGEGISMAIQSAWLLCGRLVEHRERLLGGGSHAVIGHDYARDWRKNFAARLRWAALFSHLAMRPGAAGALLPVLRRWPGLLTLGALVGGKVRCVSRAAVGDVLPPPRKAGLAASPAAGAGRLESPRVLR